MENSKDTIMEFIVRRLQEKGGKVSEHDIRNIAKAVNNATSNLLHVWKRNNHAINYGGKPRKLSDETKIYSTCGKQK